MSRFLSDYSEAVWSFVAASVFAVLLAIVTDWIQSNRKILDWTLRANIPLVSPALEHIGSGLTVNWNDRRLSRPRVVLIRIVNTGRRTVKQDEYSSGITVDVPGAHIIEATITNMTNSDVMSAGAPLPVQPESSQVEFQPAVMHKKDYLGLRLLVEGDVIQPKISARFTDQTRAMRSTDTVGNRWQRYLTYALTIFAGYTLFPIFYEGRNEWQTYLIFALAIAIFSSVVVTVRNSTKS